MILSKMLIRLSFLLLSAAHVASANYIMYLTGQHNVVPDPALAQDITHVALAFMRSHIFNSPAPAEWPLFTTVDSARSKFPNTTAIMVAIGGWGDTEGFSQAAATETSRELFAKNVKLMVDATGADGVDIDWEYPGGNGENYKTIPNPTKAWEITAYPLLLSSLRSALGPNKLISAAVPGLRRDMLAFTPTTVPQIAASLDFFNIMTYDLMNRRDNVTKHHTGVALSLDAINAYTERGVPKEKANLGFAFYVKWYKTATSEQGRSACKANPVGCPTVLLEDPITGGDLGGAGAFSWHDEVPGDMKLSWEKAQKGAKYDEVGGGNYYWDEDEDLWWSWDTPEAIAKKFPLIVEEKGLGGVFAWGLGEDAPAFEHLQAATEGWRKVEEKRRREKDIKDEL